MKRLSLIFILLIPVILADAQKGLNFKNDGKNQHPGKCGIASLGWVFGLEQGYLQFNNRDIWIGGASAGILINHNFTVGVSGHAWNIKKGIVYSDVTDTTGVYLDGGYGGLILKYTVKPESMVHVSFSILFGSGGAAYFTEKEYTRWDNGKAKTYHKMLATDIFYAIEPGWQLQLNLLKFLRLNAGVSYCYAGSNLSYNTSNLMNNFRATIGLELGKF
jgi:hypothetical protein